MKRTHYLEKVKKCLETRSVLLCGVEGVGISTLLAQATDELFEKYDIISCAAGESLCALDLGQLGAKPLVVIDDLDDCVDCFKSVKKLLSHGVRVLAGAHTRHCLLDLPLIERIRVLPYSLNELLEIYPEKEPHEVLKIYFHLGGMPRVHALDDDSKRSAYFRDLLEDICVKVANTADCSMSVDTLKSVAIGALSKATLRFTNKNLLPLSATASQLVALEDSYLFDCLLDDGRIDSTHYFEKYFACDLGMVQFLGDFELDLRADLLQAVYHHLLLNDFNDLEFIHVDDLESVDLVARKGERKMLICAEPVIKDARSYRSACFSLARIDDPFAERWLVTLSNGRYGSNKINHSSLLPLLLGEAF